MIMEEIGLIKKYTILTIPAKNKIDSLLNLVIFKSKHYLSLSLLLGVKIYEVAIKI